MKTRKPRLTTLTAMVAVAAFGLLVSDFAAAGAGQGAGRGPGYGAGWQARQNADIGAVPRGPGAGWGQARPRAGPEPRPACCRIPDDAAQAAPPDTHLKEKLHDTPRTQDPAAQAAVDALAQPPAGRHAGPVGLRRR